MTKQKIPLYEAEQIAQRVIAVLAPHCERIEIAGSIRRRKPEVGDIEIVASPKIITDLFGQPIEEHELDTFDFSSIGTLEMGGHKYKKIALTEGPQLEILIRTGPAEYSHSFVTPKMYGGLLPSPLRVKDGAIWKNELLPLETPEESDVYNLLGLPYVEPWERAA